MRNPVISIFLSIFFLAGSPAMLFAAPETSTANETVRFVLESDAVDTNKNTINIGDYFTVDLFVDPNDVPVDTARARIQFDASKLQYIGIDAGSRFERLLPSNPPDQSLGTFEIGATTTQGSITESVRLATVHFRAIETGDATIQTLSTSHLIQNGVDLVTSESVAILQVNVKPASDTSKSLLVTCSSHPTEGEWVANPVVDCEWDIDDSVDSYFVSLDAAPDAKPDLETNKNSVTFNGRADGIWYVHVLAKHSDGTTSTFTQSVNIDTTKPNDFPISVPSAQLLDGESITLSFSTVDLHSETLHYALSVNDGPYEPVISPYTSRPLITGDYLLKVEAKDGAGNTRYSALTLRVYPKGTTLGRGMISDDESPKDDEINLPIRIVFLVLIFLPLILLIRHLKRRSLKQTPVKSTRTKK